MNNKPPRGIKGMGLVLLLLSIVFSALEWAGVVSWGVHAAVSIMVIYFLIEFLRVIRGYEKKNEKGDRR